jgi:hypothetical protein
MVRKLMKALLACATLCAGMAAVAVTQGNTACQNPTGIQWNQDKCRAPIAGEGSCVWYSPNYGYTRVVKEFSMNGVLYYNCSPWTYEGCCNTLKDPACPSPQCSC